MILTTAVPSTAAGIVSGTVGLALNHAFEAAFIARTIISPMSRIMQSASNKAIRAFGGNDGSLEARLRANERIAPPKTPDPSIEAQTGAPSNGSYSGPNTGTLVRNPKLTRHFGPGGGLASGSTATRQFGNANNGTSNMNAGATKATNKI